MLVDITVTKFDMTNKKVSIGIEIEYINPGDIPELLEMIRSAKIQEMRLKEKEGQDAKE